MIRLIKNIFGKNKKEVVSLREKSRTEVSEPQYQPEITELEKEEIQEPKITELTEEEINNFIEKEVNRIFSFINGTILLFSKIYSHKEISIFPLKEIALTLVGSQKMYMLKYYIEAEFKVHDLEIKTEIEEKLYRFGIIDEYVKPIESITELEKLFLFYEKYYENHKNDINKKIDFKKQGENKIVESLEKERIKQEYIEKERYRKLRDEARKELISEGILLKNISLETSERHISQEVKNLVWNRDNGKCVQCGSNEKLEFDHIIPFSKGGSNTYRNIQLLCEKCNREKSNKIG